VVDALIEKKLARTRGLPNDRELLGNLICGGIIALWCYADTHISRLDTLLISLDGVAQVMGLPPKWVELIPAKWLVINHEAGTVTLPHYCEKNGLITRKQHREQNAERQRRYRERNASHNVTQPSPERYASVTEALPPYPYPIPNPIKKKIRRSSPVAESLLPRRRARPPDPSPEELKESLARARERIEKQPGNGLDDRAARAAELLAKDPGTQIGDAARLFNVPVAAIEAAQKGKHHGH
jgi:hypothetical protein